MANQASSLPPGDASANILPTIGQRWSPYRFLPQIVEQEKLTRCLEAARWAASSYNDQPWSFLLAKRENLGEFQQALACLLDANRVWAANAGVILLTVTRTTFRQNGKPNRVALHDLGGATTSLALQATAEGLQAHQMAGINLSQVRSAYKIPTGFEPQTAIAIGYPDERPAASDDPLAARDNQTRVRLPLSELVFAGEWGTSANLDG
ncbi:nitroreductase family protein [Planctomycetaceae bacterium SH139]